jgi:polysaccharide pyruvyl transferase CsaB
MKNVFLFGYYGFDNLGDDLILSSIVEKFGSEFKFNVLTYNYHKTKKFVDVNPISRSNFSSIIKSIKNSDVIASGGGSLLQDETSSKSLYFYLGLILLGKLFNKKIIFLFNGIGPVNKKINRVIMKNVLKTVDVIFLRDYESLALLKKIGITTNAEVVGDAVFLKKYNVETTYLMKKNSKKIIISLRKWKNFDDMKVNQFIKLIDLLIEKGYLVELLPLKYPDDAELLMRIKSKVKGEIDIIDKEISNDELFNKIENCHFLIGERLHSLIISAICETPIIGIEYDPKIKGFVKMVNQLSSIETKNISFELLSESVNILESNYEFYYKELKRNKIKISNDVNKSVLKIINNMK